MTFYDRHPIRILKMKSFMSATVLSKADFKKKRILLFICFLRLYGNQIFCYAGILIELLIGYSNK